MAKETTEKPVKKTAAKKEVTPKMATPKVVPSKKETKTSLSVPMLSLEAKESGVMNLPAVFEGKVNNALLAQAIRVYMANRKDFWSHTKTRSEVRGSSAKMGAQKGSGHARHGTKRSPVFVGGGIALGPRTRDVELALPKSLRQQALVAALRSKVQSGAVYGVDGFDKVTGKTSQMSKFVKTLAKGNVLFVVENEIANAHRAVRNLADADLLPVEKLNALEIVRHTVIAFTKEAANKVEIRMEKK
jgi:large subunit ribosomal protein L4